MNIISFIVSLPISVILIMWILKMKKDNPFPKGTVKRVLIWGALISIFVTLFSLMVGFVVASINVGPDKLFSMMPVALSGDQASALKIQEEIENSQNHSFLAIFIRTFLAIALVEEFFKFLVMRSSVRRIETDVTWLDVVFIGALAGLGFQIFEDITYSSQGLGLSIVRALTPFHFVFGALMGYLYGKALLSKNKMLIVISIIVPAFIHGLYDAALKVLNYNESMIILAFIITLMMFAFFIFQIIRINKWYKTKELDTKVISISN